MKTKRLAWVVAGVVVVLSALTLRREVYEFLAYEKHVMREFVFSQVATFDLGARRDADINVEAHRPGKKLRWEWLPGPTYMFEEICGNCKNANHQKCNGTSCRVYGEHDDIFGASSPLSRLGEIGQPFTCTCPDPSHKDKP